MRRLSIAVLLAALFAVAPLRADKWITSGIQVNPAANTILADYQYLEGGGTAYVTFHFTCSQNVAIVVFMETRDATNTTTLKSHAYTLSNGNVYDSMRMTLLFNDNERVRLRVNAGVTGAAQCSIFLD